MIKTTLIKPSLFLLAISLSLHSIAQLTGVAPNKGNRGQTLPIIISGSAGNFTAQGSGTHFYMQQGSFIIGPGSSTTQGTSTGDFSNVQIVNGSEIHADMTIPFNAPIGNYYVHASAMNTGYGLQNGFEVLQGTATGVSMKQGGGKPGNTVNEEFTWNNLDLTGQTITHMWLSKNGTTINTLTNPTIVLKNTDVTVTIQIPASAEFGYWKVNMLTNNGEVYESPASFLIDATFKVDDNYLDATAVKVYPNPTAEKLTVEFPEMENGNIRLVDLNGRIIQDDEIENHSSQFTLDVTSVKSGIYMVQVLNGKRVLITKKVIIQ